MLSLLFRLLGDASPLKRTLAGVRNDAKRAGQDAGKEFDRGMGASRGTGLRRLVGGARAIRAGVAGIGGSAAVGFVRGQIEEGTRLAHLAQQLGITVEQLQKAELAQKLYGDSVLKSTEALSKAVKSLDNVPVISEKTAKMLAEEGKAWTLLWAKMKVGLAGVGAAISQGARISPQLSIPALVLDWLVPKGKPGGVKNMDSIRKFLGGPDAPNRPSLERPRSDALTRIGLFVGTTTYDKELLRTQKQQLQTMLKIHQALVKLNSQLN
jgi:hypothetical protein